MLKMDQLDFEKLGGLIPAVIQNQYTMQVLMVGFMNQEALSQTIKTGLVTFFSRSKNKIWTKGETSGNFLKVNKVSIDCDKDSILIYVTPTGPTCHSGNYSCFNCIDFPPAFWLARLDEDIEQRRLKPQPTSYTTQLLQNGVDRIAQKVGEEGVEVAIAAVNGNKQSLAGEAFDLIYHLFVLLQAKEVSLSDVANVIQERNKCDLDRCKS